MGPATRGDDSDPGAVHYRLRASARALWVALLGGIVTGCGTGAVLLYPIAGPVLVGGVVAAFQATAWDKCRELGSRGFVVSEWSLTEIPDDEGPVRVFEPVLWRTTASAWSTPAFRSGDPALQGRLVTTKRSILFLAPPGETGLRIPYETVGRVWIDSGSPSSPPPFVVVGTACGRYESFTFLRSGDQGTTDPEATASAARTMETRALAVSAPR